MRRIASLVLLLASSLVLGGSLAAQAAPRPPAPRTPVVLGAPQADPADVSSIDAIVAALYDVISGGVGEARDWGRMRSLFIPGGRLMPLGMRPDSSVGIRLLEVNDYIAISGPQLERIGFREREIARRTERFGHLAHVFSTYEGRMEDGRTIRGINSIQLMNDGTRWWVVSVFWEAEGPTNPLPPEYLTTP